MIHDLRTHDADGADIECDLCIAGAGAAGITLALQFIGSPLTVVFLESGSFDYDEEVQELYRGEIVGRDYYPLDADRLRYFGGTTNHWNGRCRPLDPLDFEARSWVPHSGWPIGPGDLAPYRDRAHEILDLGPSSYDPGAVVPPGGLLPFDPDLLVHRLWRFSPPTRFNDKYRRTLEEATNVTVFLNASVTDIVLTDDLRRTRALEVGTLGGRRLRVAARRASVLALGGLENPRLLLNANRQIPVGVGNQNDLVGRFFMEHPEGVTGEVVLDRPLSSAGLHYHTFAGPGGHELLTGICVSATAQEREQILNHGLQLDSLTRRETFPGYAALHELLGDVADGEFADLGQQVWEVMRDIGGTARGLYERATRGEEEQIEGVTLLAYAEQAPNPDSRVRLTDEVDRLGLRRIALDWRLSPLDMETMRTTSRLLARELGRLGIGRLRLPEWLEGEGGGGRGGEPLRGGHHHIGTTRMADDPKRGVVDRNCRVHSVDNLYVAGSSVFPTAGFANPTLTIVELALRLADHLR